MKEKIESVKLIYLTIFFDLDIFKFFGTLNKMHRNTITKFVISREFMVVKHIISFKNIRLIYETVLHATNIFIYTYEDNEYIAGQIDDSLPLIFVHQESTTTKMRSSKNSWRTEYH